MLEPIHDTLHDTLRNSSAYDTNDDKRTIWRVGKKGSPQYKYNGENWQFPLQWSKKSFEFLSRKFFMRVKGVMDFSTTM